MDAVDRIRPSVRPGERLVVRYRLLDGSATDLIGWLESVTPDELSLRDRHGELVRVGRKLVIVARRAPPARGGRNPMLTSPDELERISLYGWVADSEPLGEWTLRAAGGFTGRANSCLAVGDPGMPVDAAARRIVDFASAHGIPPRAQVIDGSGPEDRLRSLGWTDVHFPAEVLVARLGDVLGEALPDPLVLVSESLDRSWWDAYQVGRPNTADPDVVRAILDGHPPRAFAGVGEGRLIAIGRAHVSADWMGITSIWTDPRHRRRGWATKIMNSLGHWAARLGARNVYVQVPAANEPALLAYQRAGFTRHHGYRYLAAPP